MEIDKKRIWKTKRRGKKKNKEDKKLIEKE